MFGFLKRGETSEPVKRPPSFERELFSCRQQQNTPPNPYINNSSFSLKWNMSLSIEDVWRDIFLLLLICPDYSVVTLILKAAGQK